MKKKKKRTRLTKKYLDKHRKLIRKEVNKPEPKYFTIDREKYMLAMVTLKRKLFNIASDIAFIMANANFKGKEHHVDLNHAREYVMFARERLGDTEFIFTDVPSGKKKLNRKKKGKLNRRR
jgi:hypothetical protein